MKTSHSDMFPRNPQHIADFFQLYFVLRNHVWHGCRVEPVWNGLFWDTSEAGVEVMIDWRAVLYNGDERYSLHRPNKEAIDA